MHFFRILKALLFLISLILFALGFRFFYSLFSNSGFGFFYQGLIGLGIFFVLGSVFYYGRIFAGGDAKLMIALGTILPFFDNFFDNLKIFILFFILFLFIGAVYGLVISTVLLVKKYRKFKKKFPQQIRKYKNLIFLIDFIALFLMILEFNNKFLFVSSVLIFIFPYFYVYSKTLDEYCMIRKVKTKNLIEGDWLVKDLKIGKKLIKANWEGLSEKDIKFIQKHKKSVEIKQGIAFAPVFFISFLILVLLYFMGYLNFLSFFFGF